MASVLPMSCTWRDLRVPAEGLEGAVLLVTVERKLINVTFERVLRLKRERTDRRVAAYWGRAETKGAARGDRRRKRRAHSSTYYGLRLRWRLRTPRQRFETHPPHFRASINLLQPTHLATPLNIGALNLNDTIVKFKADQIWELFLCESFHQFYF